MARPSGNLAATEALNESCVDGILYNRCQVDAEIEVLDDVWSSECKDAGQADRRSQREGHVAAEFAPDGDSKYCHTGEKWDRVLADMLRDTEDAKIPGLDKRFVDHRTKLSRQMQKRECCLCCCFRGRRVHNRLVACIASTNRMANHWRHIEVFYFSSCELLGSVYFDQEMLSVTKKKVVLESRNFNRNKGVKHCVIS